jgi:site-specific DNA-cytosine methylase
VPIASCPWCGHAGDGTITYDTEHGGTGNPGEPDLGPEEEAQSEICLLADGLPAGLDRAMQDRTKRLSRLGNAVVPDCAEWIARRLAEFDEVYA